MPLGKKENQALYLRIDPKMTNPTSSIAIASFYKYNKKIIKLATRKQRHTLRNTYRFRRLKQT